MWEIFPHEAEVVTVGAQFFTILRLKTKDKGQLSSPARQERASYAEPSGVKEMQD
jgi:hypothetical protein